MILCFTLNHGYSVQPSKEAEFFNPHKPESNGLSDFIKEFDELSGISLDHLLGINTYSCRVQNIEMESTQFEFDFRFTATKMKNIFILNSTSSLKGPLELTRFHGLFYLISQDTVCFYKFIPNGFLQIQRSKITEGKTLSWSKCVLLTPPSS